MQNNQIVIPGASLSDTSKNLQNVPINDGPRFFVKAFAQSPVSWLEDTFGPFLELTGTVCLMNPCGRGSLDKTFPKRFDNAAMTATSPFWCDGSYTFTYSNVAYAIRNFLRGTSGLSRAFAYMGAPRFTGVLPKTDAQRATQLSDALVRDLRMFLEWFPNTTALYDNDGVALVTYAEASLYYAAIHAVKQSPIGASVEWGVEPNPPSTFNESVFAKYAPTFMCGTPATWEAPTRIGMETASLRGHRPVVLILGGAANFPTPEQRIEAAKKYRELVRPLNGHVIVTGLTAAQYADCL